MSFQSQTLSLTDLDNRARDVFRSVVESYLETGQPVGSRTLARDGRISLSPASIRNTMSDLVDAGLLGAAHISAGRIPTHQGLRLFVDGLLEVGDLSPAERKKLDESIAADTGGRDPETLMGLASQTLSGLAGGAGLVLTPQQGGELRHVEFVNLGNAQALAILVYENGQVENRLMNLPLGLPGEALERAGNFLSARLKGRRLDDARSQILTEIKTQHAALDAAARNLIAQGLAQWSEDAKSGAANPRRNLIVRGRAQLLDNVDAQTDLERVRMIFDDLDRKDNVIALLDQAKAGEGVKLFIGAENPLFSLSGSSVVVAPFRDKRHNIVGAVGVIGPTRINYARVIPVVDYTAKIVGRLLRGPSET